ncbi:16S rRNA (uracil(1498)-N(3))-methyltransferase [Chamaesiphon sp. GL140_3_metabinner_50]|uniref:16S rRNA (uracil(1498)-N(3))-methyltransferase n=1 Tax=Chamaesiphon sp. GL140_3_metabinner_50 TaxID=2970812 RepID=UPI0025E78168|nr:16S rRNA (uracil(1498)-N(3))-methyltransferase [Chamaesiphon sp. GL140_3_metabinner_50]
MQRITIDLTQIHDNYINLVPEQDRYLTRVLRLQSGGQFQAIDGTGKLYICELIARDPRAVTASAQITEIIISPDRPLAPAIALICALPKGNNFDDIVRACTELGVTTIYPAISDRTLLDPSLQKRSRWRKIAQEAVEQSERLTIPTIADPQALQAIFSQIPSAGMKFLCEARGEHPHLLTCLQARSIDNTPIVIAIGPEGGWTNAEIALASESGFQLVSLGQQILRTITAPIVALSIVAAAIDIHVLVDSE